MLNKIEPLTTSQFHEVASKFNKTVLNTNAKVGDVNRRIRQRTSSSTPRRGCRVAMGCHSAKY